MERKYMIWQSTKLTALANLNYPIVQAPMAGGATTAELVAAVSNAGGLGSLGAGYLSAEDTRKTIKNIRQLTERPKPESEI
jgi:nitronate monooxygenase